MHSCDNAAGTAGWHWLRLVCNFKIESHLFGRLLRPFERTPRADWQPLPRHGLARAVSPGTVSWTNSGRGV
jgi:hypothetical protein